MTNSYVGYIQEVYEGVFRDYLVTFPDDRREIKRDMSRFLFLAQRRGLGFFSLDLPLIGKGLDLSLAAGVLSLTGYPHCGSAKKGWKVPSLLKGLFLRVFEPSGSLRSDADVNAIFLLRQIFYLAKKISVECSTLRTMSAVQDFYQLEGQLDRPSLDWNGDDELDHARHLCLTDRCQSPNQLDLFPEDNRDEAYSLMDTIQNVSDVVFSSFEEFIPENFRAKHGPGAVSDLGKMESKFHFPNWSDKLSNVFPPAAWAFHSYGAWIDSLQGVSGTFPESKEMPSRLIVVPKTRKAPRLIASEPTSHMFTQQCVRSYIEHSVGKSVISGSISFQDQNPNARLARRASQDQSHWTIDLSSASDCVSCWMVERMVRANSKLLRALHSVRTRWVVNSIDIRIPKYINLRKYAPMGSAITFPLQTALYTCIAIGVYHHLRGIRPSLRSIKRVSEEIRVFGDDIIVPSEIGLLTVRALTYLGFKVNPAKTFGTGMFRESCGMEAYAGYDVTPAYVKAPPQAFRPESIVSNVECSNNFFKKGLWHTAEKIRQLTERIPLSREIPMAPIDSGILSWSSFSKVVDYRSNKRRFNKHLQRYEVRMVALKSKTSVVPVETNASCYQYFIDSPAPHILWKAGVRTRPSISLNRRWEPIDRPGNTWLPLMGLSSP